MVETGAFTHIQGMIQVHKDILFQNNSIPSSSDQLNVINVDPNLRKVIYTELDSNSFELNYNQFEGSLLNSTIERIEMEESEEITEWWITDKKVVNENVTGFISKYLIPSVKITGGTQFLPYQIDTMIVRYQKFDSLVKVVCIIIDKNQNCYRLSNVGYITNLDAYAKESDIHQKSGDTWTPILDSKDTLKPSIKIKLPNGYSDIIPYSNSQYIIKVTYDLVCQKYIEETSTYGNKYYTLLDSSKKEGLFIESSYINQEIEIDFDDEELADGFYSFNIIIKTVEVFNTSDSENHKLIYKRFFK